MRETLVTIHGINSDGDWQDEIRPVLAPFFNYIPLRYDEYRWRGELKLMLGSFAVPIVLVGAVLIAVFGTNWPTRVLVFFLLVVLGGSIEAYRLRERVTKKIRHKLDQELLGIEGHIVAHSLGTLLIGAALQRFPDVNLGRIVFAGCVLPSDFDWKEIYRRRGPFQEEARGPFKEVRNEVGAKDRVVWLAGIMAPILGGLGPRAGKEGFRPSDPPPNEMQNLPIEEWDFIHNVDGEYGPCSHCRTAAKVAKVHNFTFPYGRHRFVTQGHALRFWLPFLLGMCPNEYRTFLGLCSDATRFEDEEEFFELRVTESAIRDQNWGWAGRTLKEYVEAYLVNRISVEFPSRTFAEQEVQEIVDQSIRYMWRLVDRALHELRNKKEKGDQNLIQALNPRFAAKRAVNQALQNVRT